MPILRLALLLLAVARMAVAQDFVLEHVNVVDVRAGHVLADSSVAIADRRIAGLYPGAAPKSVAGRRIDGQNGYLIPGLFDMHVHTAMGNRTRDESVFERIWMPLFLAHGVTGVRDMGSDLARLEPWREEIRSGKIRGPRIWMAGEMIDGPTATLAATIKVTTASEARQAVDRLRRAGADFIKVQSVLGRDAYFAVADEAKKQRIPFVGHVPNLIGAGEASDAGQKSLEHEAGLVLATSKHEAELLKKLDDAWHAPDARKATAQAVLDGAPLLFDRDDARARAFAEKLAHNGTWLCPTTVWGHESTRLSFEQLNPDDPVTQYVPASTRRGWAGYSAGLMKAASDPRMREMLPKFTAARDREMTRMHEAGVRFLAGTDTPAPLMLPGASLLAEIESFGSLGFTPLQALQTATINPAIFLGVEKDAGTVEQGKWADLVLLAANPLEDLHRIRGIRAVVADGHYFDRGALERMLQDVVAAARAFDAAHPAP